MVGVVGSNPIAPTKYQNGIKFTGLIPFFFGHVAHRSVGRINKRIPKRYRISKRSDAVCESAYRTPIGTETIGVYPRECGEYSPDLAETPYNQKQRLIGTRCAGRLIGEIDKGKTS